jgi:hypothetical protein
VRPDGMWERLRALTASFTQPLGLPPASEDWWSVGGTRTGIGVRGAGRRTRGTGQRVQVFGRRRG